MEPFRTFRRRGRLVTVVLVSVVAGIMLWSFLTRPVYEGVVKILIERENPKVLSFKEVAEVDSGRDDYYQTQYKLLQNRALLRKLLEKVDLFQEPEFGGPRSDAEVQAARSAAAGTSILMEGTVDRVLRRVAVVPDKNTRLVNLRFESYRPDLAAQVANTLAQLYIDQTLEFRYKTSADAGRWLAVQIQDERKKLEDQETALRKLKEREGIVNIEERRALLQQKLKELGTAATTLKTTRLEKEAVFQHMKGAPRVEDLPAVIKNPVIQALRIELGTLGRKEAQLAEKYLDRHPELLQVRRQIEDTRSRLAVEAQRIVLAAENEYQTARAQEESVLTALDAAKAEAQDLERRSGQYDTRKHELDAGTSVLGTLLSRAKETDVTQELRASNIRIVDPATVPRKPVRPDRVRDFALSVILGLGASLGLALLLDHLDSSIKNIEDVRRYVQAPLLGVLPEADKDTESSGLVFALGGERSPDHFFEGYRVLRTALQYSWSEPAPRVVMVTSSVPGEGKTLTSVNLSRSLVAGGSRVLLVDCDLRKPQAHDVLRHSRAPGLSDVLVGKAELEDVVRNEAGTRFDLMTAGTVVPSPADLLTGSTVKRLVERLKGLYEWVVLDTPPVGVVADPLILAPYMDGAIVIIGADMVHRSAGRETLRRLTESGVRVLGVVLNRVRRDQSAPYYHHYYAYNYGPQADKEGRTVQSTTVDTRLQDQNARR